MYRRFYGLTNKPFELSPDSELIYLSDVHREALATLRYGVISDKGFLMLTGGIGTGKTTILNSLLKMVRDKVRICLLNNPTLTRQEFYYFLATKLGLHYAGNKGDFILKFSELLEECARKKEKILFIIDEAQVFPLKLLEEVRLLSNQAGEQNVLSIFLVGQPELQDVLAHPRLLPLRQRIGINYHLKELERNDTAHYIAFRLHKAGAPSAGLFSEEAIDTIHQASMGNPRLINIICDHALISGFAKDSKQIDRDIIVECLEELRFSGEGGPALSESPGRVSPPATVRKSRARRRRWGVFSAVLFGLTLLLTGGVVYVLGWGEGWTNLWQRWYH
ncbi:Flp pilus assembly complex ATPase component TadA [bacterium]|nr:Flp pilus assembly complex ATPase component TadA [bacterium]